MQFHIVDLGDAVEEVNHVWNDLYADLYRETHEETATDAEIIADAELRLQILTRPEIDDPNPFNS